MYLSLPLLKASPFPADHSETLVMPFSNLSISCRMPLGRHVLWIVVSSAYWIESESIQMVVLLHIYGIELDPGYFLENSKVKWNELLQKGFVIDGVKSFEIVNEYWYCYLCAIQSFSNVISEFKYKGCCRMTLTKTRRCRVVDSRLFDVVFFRSWYYFYIYFGQNR